MKKTIKVKKPLLDALTLKGNRLRRLLDNHNVYAFNIMASPGAGKTSVIMKIIDELKGKYRIAVIEGDIVPIDVDKIKKQNIPVVLAQTGGSCHLDSIMMEKALQKIDLTSIDLLLVENVGNLICPASFYLGTHKNIVIASVPEGDDKPYKYPTMFKGADAVILNKTDYLIHETFNVEEFNSGVLSLDSSIEIFPVSCKTCEGLDSLTHWMKTQITS